MVYLAAGQRRGRDRHVPVRALSRVCRGESAGAASKRLHRSLAVAARYEAPIAGGRHETSIAGGRREAAIVGGRYEAPIAEGRREAAIAGGRHEAPIAVGRHEAAITGGPHFDMLAKF